MHRGWHWRGGDGSESSRELNSASPTSSARRLAEAALRRARAWLPREPRPAILMFHRVADESFDPWGLAVAPERFARQMRWLARNREVLPLVDFAHLHQQQSLPANAIALTFDDGYACNAAAAVPVLGKLGIPATIFIAVEPIERAREFWWDELERIVLGHRAESLRLDGEPVHLGEQSAEDRSWRPGAPPRTPRQRAFQALRSRLRAKPLPALQAAMDQLREQAGTDGAIRASHRPLTAQEVRSIRSPAIEFGSHTLTHASLPLLATAEKANEIQASIERCQTLTGQRPRSFAYPFGDYDEESEGLVRAAGFACGCTTEQSPVRAGANRFALPRLAVGNWSPGQLKRALADL